MKQSRNDGYGQKGKKIMINMDRRKEYRKKIEGHTLGDTLAELRNALDTSTRAGAFYASYQLCVQIEALERIIEDQVNIAHELQLSEGDPFLE